MRLYMREKYLSFREDFNITDKTGLPVYRVKGRLLSIGRQLRVIDIRKNSEVAEVKQKVTAFMPRMDVYVEGDHKATVQKKLTILKPRYEIKALGWKVKGDVLKHNYRIIDADRQVIARIKKKFFTFTDTFQCDINDDQVDPVMVIAVILAIDLAMDSESEK